MAYDRDNIFARILRGELPCTKLYEDEHVLAFRDIEPQAPSHVVLIPKGDYVSADDFSATASDAELAAFMRAIAKIAKAEGIADGGYRILANTGTAAHQAVPHFHLHLFGGRDLGARCCSFSNKCKRAGVASGPFARRVIDARAGRGPAAARRRPRPRSAPRRCAT